MQRTALRLRLRRFKILTKTVLLLVRTFTEQYISYKKEGIKNDILKKLGMTKAPNVSNDMAPKHLIHQMMEKYARTKRNG